MFQDFEKDYSAGRGGAEIEMLFARPFLAGYFRAVSTLMEIQEAVTRLPADEKIALSLWLNSQAPSAMTAQEEQQLLHSLDEAIRDVDAGPGVSMADAHKLVATWVAK
jgi:hypothetical protein